MPYLRQHHRGQWTPLVALVMTLVCVFLVLPVAASVIARIAQARWEAAHPPQTLVPNVTGRDPVTAEVATQNAHLHSSIHYVSIEDKCWQDLPAPNTVVDQQPEALTPVAVDSQVELT